MTFYVVLLIVLVLAQAYAWRRVCTLFWPRRRGLWLALTIVSMLWLVATGAYRRVTFRHDWLDGLLWASYLYVGALSVLVVLLPLADAVGWWRRVRGGVRRPVGTSINGDRSSAAATRRELLQEGPLWALIGAGGLTVAGVITAQSGPRLERVEVPIAGLPRAFDGYRILQMSDLHVGPTVHRGYVESVVRQMRLLPADLIAVTGDLVDGRVPALWRDMEPLLGLSAPDGVWFVTGNHEYYSGVQQWLDWVRRAGWTALVNEHRAIERRGDRLILGGVTDYRAGRRLPAHRSDPAGAFAGAGQGARLLLAHQPKSVLQARGLDVQLALCGHTHGGQYVPWNLVVEFFHPYVRGLNRDPDGAWVYVSRGTGFWGPPLRTGIPAELTLLTLRAV